jgi:acetate kinase
MNEITTLFPEGGISVAVGRVVVHVIRTNEERMISKTVCGVGFGGKRRIGP